jgi:hypothetical protein
MNDAPLPPAGWYPDPEGGSGTRYWDGSAWTSHVSPAPATPPPAPGYPAFGAGAPQGYGGIVSPAGAVQSPASSLYLAAAILNWVVLGLLVLGTCGVGIIAALWFVPMTIYIHKGARDPWKHVGLAVCTLLFCGLISGILMLADEGNRRDRPLA